MLTYILPVYPTDGPGVQTDCGCRKHGAFHHIMRTTRLDIHSSGHHTNSETRQVVPHNLAGRLGAYPVATGVTTSFVPENVKTDGLGSEPSGAGSNSQPGIGSREDVLVGAVFVPGEALLFSDSGSF